MNKFEEKFHEVFLLESKYFNGFKTPQDQKYYLWHILSDWCCPGTKREGRPFTINKYSGSNQVVLEKNGQTVYNNDENIFTVEEFEKFLAKIVLDFEENGVIIYKFQKEALI